MALYQDGEIGIPQLTCAGEGAGEPKLVFAGTPSDLVRVQLGEYTSQITREEIAALAALFPVPLHRYELTASGLPAGPR